jgi:hypothetical protein
VEPLILNVFLKYRSLGFPISGPLLRLLALQEAKKRMEQEETTEEIKAKYALATFGKKWLEGFKKPNGIRGNIRVNG